MADTRVGDSTQEVGSIPEGDSILVEDIGLGLVAGSMAVAGTVVAVLGS